MIIRWQEQESQGDDALEDKESPPQMGHRGGGEGWRQPVWGEAGKRCPCWSLLGCGQHPTCKRSAEIQVKERVGYIPICKPESDLNRLLKKKLRNGQRRFENSLAICWQAGPGRLRETKKKYRPGTFH